jgi:hypothetical protein
MDGWSGWRARHDHEHSSSHGESSGPTKKRRLLLSKDEVEAPFLRVCMVCEVVSRRKSESGRPLYAHPQIAAYDPTQ